MKQFYTKEAHSTPQKLPLYLPNGEASEDYLMLLGAESSEFRKAKAQGMRKAMLEAKDGELTQDNQDSLRVDMLISVIDSWSFDEECNDDNKRELLINAPYLCDSIDSFCANSDNFVKK